jgi:hypothetical protein
MLNYTHVIAQPGAPNIIDAVHPNTGRGMYSDETLAQVRERYPGADTYDFVEWCTARGAEQSTPIEWAETTQALYHEMMDVLPPVIVKNCAFLVGEPMDHLASTGEPRFEAFRYRAGGHYEVANRPLTVAEFRGEVPA